MTQKRAGLLSPLTTALAAGALLLASVACWVLFGTADAADCGSPGCSPTGDLAFDTEDLDFILNQHWGT